MCAGGIGGVDTCKGDGGSPLVCKNRNGPWYQAGIVSWGIGCGEENIPAVYASVATASCWIDSEVSHYIPPPTTHLTINTFRYLNSSKQATLILGSVKVNVLSIFYFILLIVF